MRVNPFCLESRKVSLRQNTDAERGHDDAAALKSVIDAARALSPTAAAALSWAEAHGVVFTVDRSCGLRGYYLCQSGIVGMSYAVLTDKEINEAIGTLVHEIRHAWQDYHGLMYGPGRDVLDGVRGTALVEADAFAFQTRASAEAARSLYHANRRPGAVLSSFVRAEEEMIAHKMDLKRNFNDWFKTTWRCSFYGNFVTDHHAEKTLKTPKPDMGFENKPVSALSPARKYLDSRDDADLRLLTTGFDGKPYIHPQEAPGMLLALTEPSLACRFFIADRCVSDTFSATLEKELQNQVDKQPFPPRLAFR